MTLIVNLSGTQPPLDGGSGTCVDSTVYEHADVVSHKHSVIVKNRPSTASIAWKRMRAADGPFTA